MRLLPIFLLALVTCLVGCAQQGVIVEKNSGPHPLYYSIGVDGSYAFLLRDASGAVHRQIVTPEVFERYVVGDYFNDLQAPPAAREPASATDGKTVMTAMRTNVPRSRIAKTKSVVKSKRLASRKPKIRKRMVKRNPTKRRPATKLVRKHPAPRVAQASEVPILIASVGRCR